MEEKIVLEFDENGEIVVETKGIRGASCLDDVKKLLEGVAVITHEHKASEFYSGAKVTSTTEAKVKVRRE